MPLLGRQCTGDNPLLTACAALAEAYFQAVNSLGRESFERDQADQEAHAAACEQRAAGAAP